MNRTVNIVAWDNGGGLSRDIDILSRALTDLGWAVTINSRRTRGWSMTFSARVARRVRSVIDNAVVKSGIVAPPFALNIHLEEINARYLALARRNVLIPNQEWFRESSFPHLDQLDEVWTKTRVAERIFGALGCNTRYVGWTAIDRWMPTVRRFGNPSALHIAGSSTEKGTETVLDVWSENPGWPPLTVLRRTAGYKGGTIPWRDRAPAQNIRIVKDKLDEQTVKRIQNENVIHVCPSEAEGFGHTIVEGLSAGAVVITTDAPPMNELVTTDRGLLAAPERWEPMSLGRRYFVSRRHLERCISTVLRMSAREREALGAAGRAWFDANSLAFGRQLGSRLEDIASEGRTA